MKLLELREADWKAEAACKDRARPLTGTAQPTVPARVTGGRLFPPEASFARAIFMTSTSRRCIHDSQWSPARRSNFVLSLASCASCWTRSSKPSLSILTFAGKPPAGLAEVCFMRPATPVIQSCTRQWSASTHLAFEQAGWVQRINATSGIVKCRSVASSARDDL